MYVREVIIENVRSISRMTWSVEPGHEAGWHVVIGDNGSGKSSFLRSIALPIVGDGNAEALRQDWDSWLSRGADDGHMSLTLWYDPQWDTPPRVQMNSEGRAIAFADLIRNGRTVDFTGMSDLEFLEPYRISGWFSAAYGPFRRFSGGTESERIFSARPRLAAHLSVFGEDFALTEAIRWLQDLQLRKLEQPSGGPHLIDFVTHFINQPGFLPHETRLHEIGSAGVRFRDGYGNNIRVEDLSDGYRSVLSMTFEILRQLSIAYPAEKLIEAEHPGQIDAPGVILVDEIDAHLHPTWQRRIGFWLCQHFPNIQFIVTTHSPLICQAASKGSVWRLPRPGTDEAATKVKGTELDRLIYGNVLDAYGTDLFGEDVERSDESKRMLQRLAILNRKEQRDKLTAEEREEQLHLRTILPTAADTVRAAEAVA